MRLSLDQALPGRIDDVIDALLDPAFLERLGGLANIGRPEVIDQHRDGDVVVQRVRHHFTGSLSPAVTRVIDPEKLTWIAETTYDLAARSAVFRVIPDHYGNKLRCSGTYDFVDDGGTRRRVDAELSVSVPLVGRIVERAIVGGLEAHLQAEAALLAEWVERKA